MNLMDSARFKLMGVRDFGSNRREPLPRGSLRNLFGAGNTSHVPGVVSMPLILSSMDVIDNSLSEGSATKIWVDLTILFRIKSQLSG